MSHLVVGHGERPAVSAVEPIETKLLLDGKPAALTEEPVEMNRSLYRCDAILGKQNNLYAARLKKINQSADNPVDALQVVGNLRVPRAKPLEVVVEVRQVNEIQRWLLLLLDPLGCVGDPLTDCLRFADGRLLPGHWPPESGKGELAKFLLERRPQFVRPSVNVKVFAAIRRVHRARRRGPFDVGVHVEPPKHRRTGEAAVGQAEVMPQLGRLHGLVRLLPERDLGQFVVVPAVADDAVVAWAFTGEVIGLSGAGHRRECRVDK